MLKQQINAIKKIIFDTIIKIEVKIATGIALIKAEYASIKARLKETKNKIVSYFKSWKQ